MVEFIPPPTICFARVGSVTCLGALRGLDAGSVTSRHLLPEIFRRELFLNRDSSINETR